MSKMEMPPMGEVVEPEETTVESANEQKNFLKKLAEKYPKLKPILLAGLVGLTGLKPDSSVESPRMTAEDALKNASDPEFVEQVSAFEKDAEAFGSRIPDNAVYSYEWGDKSVNHGSTANENIKGELPDSMNNFVVSVDQVMHAYSKSRDAGSNMFDGLRESVFMAPAEGQIVEKGGKITMEGYGRDRDSAVRDAYHNLISLTGFHITTDTELNSTTMDGATEAHHNEGLKETIKHNGLLLLKEAKVASVEKNPDKNRFGDIKVILEVQPGSYQK